MFKVDKKTRDFAEVFKLYYTIIRNTVLSIVNNEHDANDICQDIFLRYYRKFDEVENARKYLFSILRFAVADHYKKINGGSADIDKYLKENDLKFANSFRETRIILQEALDDMSNFEDEKERVLFDMIAIERYSYREACKILGLTFSQVRYKYEQIIKRLIDHLKKKGINNLEELL